LKLNSQLNFCFSFLFVINSFSGVGSLSRDSRGQQGGPRAQSRDLKGDGRDSRGASRDWKVEGRYSRDEGGEEYRGPTRRDSRDDGRDWRGRGQSRDSKTDSRCNTPQLLGKSLALQSMEKDRMAAIATVR